MPLTIAYILGLIAAIACTVVLFLFILPESKRESLPKFLQLVHDFFNFKFLIIEYILKGLYMLITFFCIGGGFFMLFSGTSTIDNIFTGETSFHSYAGRGILLMILGPIVTRLIYEFSMMFIVLVKNTTQINRKMPKD